MNDKNKAIYWEKHIRHVPETSKRWYAEIQHDHKRARIPLSENKITAAYKARDAYQFITLHGWDAFNAKFRPKRLSEVNPTIGMFIDESRKIFDRNPRTFRQYETDLRRIGADISGLADDPKKFGPGRRGNQQWKKAVESVKVSIFTPQNIQKWKVAALQQMVPASVNSYLRSGQSLFSSERIKYINLKLPDPLPFSEVQLEPELGTKYRSDFSVKALITAVEDDLATNHPECHKIFLLAQLVGLKRGEIDLLEWATFCWADGVLRIENRRSRQIELDEEVIDRFRHYQTRASDKFVIESDEPERPEATYRYYRCEEHFKQLIHWLRDHDVIAKKPLETLRKEFGNQICKLYGINEASRSLGHSSVKITRKFYNDSKAHATGLGYILNAP